MFLHTFCSVIQFVVSDWFSEFMCSDSSEVIYFVFSCIFQMSKVLRKRWNSVQFRLKRLCLPHLFRSPQSTNAADDDDDDDDDAFCTQYRHWLQQLH